MAQISIQDSGYIKTDNSGTQLTGNNIVNSGTVIVLKTASLKYTGGANLDDSPYIGTYDDPDVNQVGHTATGFTIIADLHKSNATELGYLGKLLKLRKTVGYKLVFYDGSAQESPSNQSIYQVAQEEGAEFTAGEKSAFSITNDNVYHIPCHVKTVTVNDSAKKGVIVVTLVCIVTKKYASSI